MSSVFEPPSNAEQGKMEPERRRYVWYTWVDKVQEHIRTVGGSKTVDGKVEFTLQPLGWYVHIGNLSIHIGEEEPPDLKAGDRVRITIEKQE